MPLSAFTTFRIGGPAHLFYRARSGDELVLAVRAARELDVPFFLLGTGANVLVGDGGYPNLVILNAADEVAFLSDFRLRASSGTRIFPDLIPRTVAVGWGGLHHFVGIPSTVGGAMWQNLHFLSPPPERERTVFIEEIVEHAIILDEEGEVRRVDRDYFEFGYDDSILHHRDDVVLGVTFQLYPESEESLRATVRENLAWRDERHPDLWLYPSAGSIFKKVPGAGAGRLVERVALRGRTIGGAQFFHKHANIIVPEIGFVGEF